MPRNRLDAETSPYLLQHAGNPVHWWAWGSEALAEAAQSDRPILLSIGYAACHWCHVMAHESFESPEIAALMNGLFVNIKVDREERPDIDAIYQQALALLGQQGGWPLTMFCTPKGEPFWGGTYFPFPARYGRPGFDAVLRGLAAAWREKRDVVEGNRTALLEALQARARRHTALATGDYAVPSLATHDQMAERLLQEVDMQLGGIGQAPKFPSTTTFEFLWRAWLRGGRRNPALCKAVTLTLDRMCQGGIYDHLGGGFARYSTDNEWLAPHFEKMLYDNAQLVDLLVLVWQETRRPLYRQRIAETCDWLLREMLAAEVDGVAAFATAFDADSEGEEGRFYVWTADQIDAALGERDGAFFRQVYDVTTDGNWEHGRSILHRNRQSVSLSDADEARLAGLRATLKAVRDRRVSPARDDKVLADWNGLVIATLANAAAALDRDDWLEAARKAFAFIWRQMRGEDRRLLHSWRSNLARHRGMLDDYANMAKAALALFEASGDHPYVEQAIELVDMLDRYYADPDGGYFTTASDSPDVIVRDKAAYDNAVPAGNATLIGVFARLWALTGEERWHQKASRQIATFADDVLRNFVPYMTLLNNSELLQAATTIVVVGDSAADTLVQCVHGLSLPNKILQRVRPATVLAPAHPAYGKMQTEAQAAAYVCRGMRCSLPRHHPDELRALLMETAPGS